MATRCEDLDRPGPCDRPGGQSVARPLQPSGVARLLSPQKHRATRPWLCLGVPAGLPPASCSMTSPSFRSAAHYILISTPVLIVGNTRGIPLAPTGNRQEWSPRSDSPGERGQTRPTPPLPPRSILQGRPQARPAPLFETVPGPVQETGSLATAGLIVSVVRPPPALTGHFAQGRGCLWPKQKLASSSLAVSALWPHAGLACCGTWAQRPIVALLAMCVAGFSGMQSWATEEIPGTRLGSGVAVVGIQWRALGCRGGGGRVDDTAHALHTLASRSRLYGAPLVESNVT